MNKVPVVFVKVAHQGGVEEEVEGQGEKCFVCCFLNFFKTFLIFCGPLFTEGNEAEFL